MKYIRTKTNVSQLKTKLNCKELYDYLIQFDNYEHDLIKVADTIEELCDGFIVEEKDHKDNWFTMSTSEFKNMELEDKQLMAKDWNHYGYIKTDKGLIYVAKMNEKGELELL